MNREAWWATVHGVAKSRMRLSDFHFHALEKEMAAHSSVLASLIAQLVKNLSAMQETPVQFLGWEDLLEEG